ncbi:hypothetical protein [Moorena sp. SIOASIH]|nr:hypothetical protein [Moorena sp. SIOASIH]
MGETPKTMLHCCKPHGKPLWRRSITTPDSRFPTPDSRLPKKIDTTSPR